MKIVLATIPKQIKTHI